MDSISMASLWRNQQDEAEERFMISNSNCYNGYGGSKIMDHMLQKVQISQLNSNLVRPAGLDHETSFAAAKSGAITSWQDTTSRELSYGPVPPLGNLVAGVSTPCSLECLLPVTNSNSNTADASVEDDGISILFTDCRNLWNCTELDQETVSHGSSDKYQRPGPTKRKIDPQSENPPRKAKKSRLEKRPSSSNINFQHASKTNNSSSASSSIDQEPDPEAIAHLKEMIYRAAAFRPVNLGLEVVEKPKRKNVRVSNDPQTVAARQRRERISERIRVLQRLVPGGSKMDTASMLDEAADYLRFLRSQVKALENFSQKPVTDLSFSSLPSNNSFFMQTHFQLQNPKYIHRPES